MMSISTRQDDAQSSPGHSSRLPVRAARAKGPQTSPSQQNPAILVPLDGSALAELVLPYACSLAKATSARLSLIRVVAMQGMVAPMFGTVPSGAVLQDIWDAELSSARDYLDQVADRLRKEGCSVDTHVVKNVDPAEAIIDFVAGQLHVTVIAMTTRGRSGLGRLLFGSIAEKVLRTSPVPLLLVRPAEGKAVAELSKMPEYHAILVPLDGSPFAEQALAAAQTVASATGAGIMLISVVSAPRPGVFAAAEGAGAALEPSERHELSQAGVDIAGAAEVAQPAGRSSVPAAATVEAEIRRLTAYLQEVAVKLRSAGLHTNTRVVSGDPAEEISAFGREIGAQPSASKQALIVMATHGRSSLQRLRLGSVALHVMQLTELPVLLVRAREPVEQHG